MRSARAKICCIADADEAALAVRLGASALGFVTEMPSGPGPIDEPVIAEILETVPPFVATFLLTCRLDADAIAAQHRRCPTTTIQLVSRVGPGVHAALRRALPGIAIVQVIHVEGPSAIDAALAAAPHVHALLLDSGRPAAAVAELGGTGRTHDWTVSAVIRRRAGVPVILAGGLGPDNVAEAIAAVRPHAVDACSRLRRGGRLDADEAAAFMTAVEGGG